MLSPLHGTGALLLGYGCIVGSAVATLRLRRGGSGTYLLALLGAVPGLLGAMLVGGLGIALAEYGAGQALPPALTAVIVMMSFCGAGIAVARWLLRDRASATVTRGALLAEAPARIDRGDDGLLRFAGVPVAIEDETKHFKVIGTTGTGKSTAIRELVTHALARGDRMVVADPDGAYLDRFLDVSRGDLILNPFDPRARRWELAGEIRSVYDADQLARSLIPDAGESDRSWRQYAQTFVAALLRQAHAIGAVDAAELHRLVTGAPTDELRLLLAATAAQPFLEPDNARMFGSIRSVAATALAALESVGAQAGDGLSVREWVRAGQGALFLPYQASQIASLRSLISTWMRLAIFETMSGGEGDRRIWFIVDELDALGAIDGLKDALARLRKFGGRCVLGWQSISQVSGSYGRAEAQSIVENCGNTLILRCSASEQGGTARFASRLIGEREIVREQLTRSSGGGLIGAARSSVSRSTQTLVESAVLPAEIEQLPDLCGYLKLASRPAWLRVTLAYR